MKVPFSPPDISELEINRVVEVLKSGWITTGPEVKEFERRIAEYIGVDKAVALSSATASLEAALHILGIGEGDEVIVPAYTYTASASPVVHKGGEACDYRSAPEPLRWTTIRSLKLSMRILRPLFQLTSAE